MNIVFHSMIYQGYLHEKEASPLAQINDNAVIFSTLVSQIITFIPLSLQHSGPDSEHSLFESLSFLAGFHALLLPGRCRLSLWERTQASSLP